MSLSGSGRNRQINPTKLRNILSTPPAPNFLLSSAPLKVGKTTAGLGSAKSRMLLLIQFELKRLGLEAMVPEKLVSGGDGYIEKQLRALYADDAGFVNSFIHFYLTQYLVDIRRRLLLIVKKNGVADDDVQAGVKRKIDPEVVAQSKEIKLGNPNLIEIPEHRVRVGRESVVVASLHSGSEADEEMAATPPMDDGETTPQKPKVSEGVNHQRVCEKSRTPMTVPHKLGNSMHSHLPPSVEVLRLRDKFYTRIEVRDCHVLTAMRLTRTEAENDGIRVLAEVEKLKDQLSDPLLERREIETLVDKIKQMAGALAANSVAASRTASGASTPQPVKRNGLPSDMFQTDDGLFFTEVRILSRVIETPPRASVERVMEDRERIYMEMKRLRALLSTSKWHNPENQQNQLLQQIERFIGSIALLPEVKLPPHVLKIRDKFYSSVDVLGSSVSTPLRDNQASVVADREAAFRIIASAGESKSQSEILDAIKAAWASVPRAN